MPTRIQTNDSNDSIVLSFECKGGHKSGTAITLNHIPLPSHSDDFQVVLGTNKGLKGNTLIVTTSVLKTSLEPKATLTYSITGTGTPNISASTSGFDEDDDEDNNVLTKMIIYKFI
ncbi:MAG: hypothetical protein K0Q79_2076 [Flavipsychrobacter sp.]|jgi:hypothetical protein|nr:hypothetical protein [Flavipsychrobacter sp.]